MTPTRKIAIGADHGGYELKHLIVEHLRRQGYEVQDFGTHGSEESVDYPDYAQQVARAVAAGEYDLGILICGTGIGMSIAANKIVGVRAAVCGDTYSARMSRLHNNANILCLGGRVLGPGPALDIVDIWLRTEFEGGRHARRVEKIRQMEASRR